MAEADLNWQDIKLNNGRSMPAIGLGTYRMKDVELIYDCVDQALSSGYRLFDTAALYGNETSLRLAFSTLLQKYGLERDNIYVTVKMCSSVIRDKARIQQAYKKSLEVLGVEYLDLCLIQSSKSDLECSQQMESTWAGLVELYDHGLVDTIGVCNYNINLLKGITSAKNSTMPAVNQVEINPLKYDKQLISYCEQNDIAIQAYHSLGGMDSEGALMKLPEVVSIAKDLEVTAAQVLLVWSLQKGFGIMPMSTKKEHIKENISLNFRLTQEQMAILDNLSVKQSKRPYLNRKQYKHKNKK